MGSLCPALYLLLICFPVATIFGQALPDLPDFPSPSPAPSPSPLPSALAEIVNASPSPPIPTAIIPGIPAIIETGSSTPRPSVSNALPPEISPSIQPASSASPSPIPSGSELLDAKGRCIRDETQPRPILGKSQLRYAVSVLLSAAAVALASVLYGLAADWEPEEVHAVPRLLWITLARILIFGAVKVSAALVASITKASPDDGALDASGAFLTWGSAIFTRLYYEGFKMTMAVLEFTDNNTVWDDKLRDFLSVRRKPGREMPSAEVPSLLEAEDRSVAEDRGVSEYLHGKLSIVQRLTGGNLERKLLLVTTVLYFASEISVLTANVLVLVGAFLQNADPNHTNFFSAEEDARQCFTSGDVPLLVGLISVQAIYAFAQQPSLVPILTVSGYCPECEKYPSFNKVLKHLRWVASFVLFLWVASLLVMPVFSKPLQPLFLVGDISLFWYVIVAPPTYSSTSYAITATFTCLAAIVGTYIIYGISKRQRIEVLSMSGSQLVES